MASHGLSQDVNILYSLQQTNYKINNGQNENVKEWDNLKDSNDNLELETATTETIEKICRTCFSLIEANSYKMVDSFSDSGYIENIINMCLPGVNLMLTKNPLVCQKCYTKLDDFYNFSMMCMKSEGDLTNYCAIKQVSGPINISDFLKHTLKQSSDMVPVKEEGYSVVIKEEGYNSCTENQDITAIESDAMSDGISLKSEEEDSDVALKELIDKIKRPRKRIRKTRTRKAKVHIRKQLHSTDMLESQVKCETCGQKFISKWALDRHTPVHNIGNQNYCCESCNIKFKYKHSYSKHMNVHLTGAPISKPFACECGKFFNRKAKLLKHQQIHEKKEKPFSCTSCGKRFIDQQQLNSHIERVHTNEKAFSCELCGNKYTSKGGLDVHFKTHFPSDNPRPEPDLMCDVCGKLFYRKYSLEKHRMSHTGDKPHSCDQCSMKFKERYQLTIHMRRHTGEKPFKCEVCSFRFPSKNRLAVHMRIHTGVRPFPCQLCTMAFTRNDHLIKHVRAIHTGERPFECDICDKTFNRKDYLLKHKRVHFKRGL